MSDGFRHSSNQQIAKNTLYLYLRMILVMCISLYTSRIILDVLGIDDFGIYNIVGGIVIFFSFINGSITGATQRFLCVALGRKNADEVRDVFSSSIIAYFMLSALILIVGETVGLWFVANKLNFPPEKLNLAITVYQISLLTAIFSLLRMPFNAAIIAYERMSFYAWSSVLEVVLKLGILFPLINLQGDKLIIYSWLICLISLILGIMYVIYVIHYFPECRIRWNCRRLSEILSFTGWSSFSAFANIGSRQGMNIIINIFCGVAVNAAVGIMNQVCNAVYGFIQSFQTAFNPPLTKLFAAGDYEGVKKMLYSTSRLSYYLLVLLSFPIMFNIELILRLWLKEVPPYTGMLCVFCLISLFFNTFGGPVWTIIQATGKIKFYQLCISSTILLEIPFFYLILWLDFPPYYVLVPVFLSNVVVVFIGVFMLRSRLRMSFQEYLNNLVFPCLCNTLLLGCILYGLKCSGLGDNCSPFPQLVLNLIVSLAITVPFIAFLGFSNKEREMAIDMLKSKLNKS